MFTVLVALTAVVGVCLSIETATRAAEPRPFADRLALLVVSCLTMAAALVAVSALLRLILEPA